jgi:Leucine-rich repeat (LRR) protein
MYNNNTIIKIDCIEKTNDEFLQSLTLTNENFIFSQLIEFNVKNKLLKNISNSSLRQLFSSNLRKLSLNDCKIKFIEKATFNFMLQLTRLSLVRNEITSIENNSFLYPPFESNILEMYLSENKLKKIERGTFAGLTRLQKLYLDENQLEQIEENSFSYLNALKELNLQSNMIKMVRNEMFFDNSNLEILHLYKNSIEDIETIPFNTLYSLKRMYLFSNKIKSINFGNFIHQQNLEELRLEKNEIYTFKSNTFIGLKNLLFLDLSANKIKQLVNDGFHGLISVSKLLLSLNDIYQIEANAFTHLNNLVHLNLDSNQIMSLKNVRFNTLLDELSLRFNLLSNLNEIKSTSLKDLRVSNNRFQEINSISHLPSLEYLDLSQNCLIKIKLDSFSSLNKLKYLNLSLNKLNLESDTSNVSYFRGQSHLETLDISFNDIQYLDTNLTFEHLISLKTLNISKNKLKLINSYLFGFLYHLNELNLASNRLSFLNDSCFFNFVNLKSLKLNSNQLKSIDFLESNKNFLYNLEELYLEHNKIVEIDFQSNFNLTFLNLNSNPLEYIRAKELTFLKSLKISNTQIKFLFLNSPLKELDLSYMNVSIFDLKHLHKLEWINLAHTKINCSLSLFLSNLTKFVDFSYNDVDFEVFNVLGSALETLKLRRTNLQDISQINLKNLINLKYLDLSLNNLSFISQDSFKFNLNLEYLDLNSNNIYEFTIILNKLKYLNLDSNRLNTTNDVLRDYNSLQTFKMANNRLQTYPSFEMSQIESENAETFLEFLLNQNQINEIKYFSFIFGRLKLANFDSNNINLIEKDAFLNCRSLEYLSLANNRLKTLAANNFHFLFSLTQLNLSHNEIEYVEENTFMNLNKLKSLDLNYNQLITIENNLFKGLSNLNDLYLLTQHEMTFFNQSFHHIPSISTIVLNEDLIFKYKCLFMNNMQRVIQRNITNKYVFYKSINLLTLNFSFDDGSPHEKCDLMFHLFQFKIHFNLKTDYENDLFYDSCQIVLIKRDKNYNHNRVKCLADFKFNDKVDEHEIKSLHSILKVVSNFYYLLSMVLLMSLLIPSFFLIFRYELFSNFISYFTKDLSSIKLEKEMKKNREKVKRLILKNEKFKINYQKEKLRFKVLMRKYDEDFRKLEEKKHKKFVQFKSSNTNSDSQMKMYDMNGKLLISETEDDIKIDILLNELNQLKNKNYNEFLEFADENRAFTP